MTQLTVRPFKLLPILLIIAACTDDPPEELCLNIDQGQLSSEFLPIEVSEVDSLHVRLNEFGLDEVFIDSAVVYHDTLKLVATYIGGCKEHEFQLITSRAYLKTNPPQSECILAHNAHDDVGETHLADTLLFDLKPLKEYFETWINNPSRTIIIKLDGYETDMWDETMWYKY